MREYPKGDEKLTVSFSRRFSYGWEHWDMDTRKMATELRLNYWSGVLRVAEESHDRVVYPIHDLVEDEHRAKIPNKQAVITCFLDEIDLKS